MNILVTGGSGFLGHYIIQTLLAHGHSVRCLARNPQPHLTKQGVDVVLGNITDSYSVDHATASMHAVFHIAAKTGIWGNWKTYFNPNVLGTRNVLNACNNHSIQYLVYTSTPSVVFNRKSLTHANESMPYATHWLCHYAHTKAIAEAEVLAAHNKNNLKTIALRPHLIWGIGDKHLIPKIIARAKAHRLRIIGPGSNLIDTTHVVNAAHAHLLALNALKKNTSGGRAYFISQDEPVNLWDWIRQLLSSLNVEFVQKHLSFKKTYSLGFCLELLYNVLHLKQDPPMTRFLALQLAKDHFFDISHAKRDLSYAPIISTQQGLQEFAAHYLKHQ